MKGATLISTTFGLTIFLFLCVIFFELVYVGIQRIILDSIFFESLKDALSLQISDQFEDCDSNGNPCLRSALTFLDAWDAGEIDESMDYSPILSFIAYELFGGSFNPQNGAFGAHCSLVDETQSNLLPISVSSDSKPKILKALLVFLNKISSAKVVGGNYKLCSTESSISTITDCVVCCEDNSSGSNLGLVCYYPIKHISTFVDRLVSLRFTLRASDYIIPIDRSDSEN